MKPQIKLDTREFDAAIRDYMRTSKKVLADVLNQKAYFIARGASRLTPRANYQRIAKELGVKLRTISTGKRAGTKTMN